MISNGRSVMVAVVLLGSGACDIRAGEVIISEIMYHPPEGKPEYIELQNLTANPLDCARWRISGGVDYTFPDFSAEAPLTTFLKPFERVLLAPVDAATLRTAYPAIPAGARIFGAYSNALSNAGETLVLQDKNGLILSQVTFNDRAPWPVAADGSGHSLEVIGADREIDTPLNWRASYVQGGTPGAAPGAPDSLHGRLHISEVAFSVSNTVAWVEVYNSGSTPIAATALWLASDATLTNRVSLTGTIPAGQYSSWDVSLPLDGNQAVLFLFDGAQTVYDAAVVDRHATRAFAQAYPAGSAEWYSASTGTRNVQNDPDRETAIVINEIMADPVSEQRDGEYIELFNRGPGDVSLAGWTLEGGVRFSFPDVVLAEGAYLVVGAHRDYLLSAYGAIPCLGNFEGRLSNDGDHVRLVDAEGNLADEVRYGFEGDWPPLARGLGSSLELVHPDLDNMLSSAWMDSDESTKSTSRSFSVTSTYLGLNTGGFSSTDVRELHFHLVGDAYLILSNVRFSRTGLANNLILNGTQLSTGGTSATGWLRQGTHGATFMSGGALHLLADGHGDNRANRVEIDLSELNAGQSYTLTFDARWVYGKPRLIAQTWDHSVGGAFIVPPPNNLGTPGAVNSRFRASAPPQVEALLHQPAVPKDSDPVVVTARVVSEIPLAAVEVVHRADNINGNGVWVRATMYDDGTNGGDQTAGDGVYSARLTSHQVNGRIVQFYVEARTTAGQTCVLPRQASARPAMWIVDNRTTASDLRTMRFVLSAYDRDALGANGETSKYNYRYPRLSNHYFNMTLIAYERDVYYGGEIRKSGSPFTRDTGSLLDRGKWKVPRDRAFRGRTKFMFDNDASGGNREKNRMVWYWLYLFGHAASESEIVRHLVNSDSAAVREEVEPPAQDFIERKFADGGRGELYRIDDEWWFADNWNRQSRDADWAYKSTEETIRYHSEWMNRSRETDYDYTAFINWTRTITQNTFSQADIERFADPVLMNIMAAVRGYIYDWDSLTLNRGKNGYFYRRPDDGRFLFLHWDSDLGFQDSNGIFLGSLPGVQNYYLKPYNRRLFDYYLGQIVDHYDHDSVRIQTWLNEENNATGSYDANVGAFLSFFSGRESRARSELGADYSVSFAVTTGNGSSVATTNDFLSLSGTAPTTVYRVGVDGCADAVLTWASKTGWTLQGIPLREGANPLTVLAFDAEDRPVQSRVFTANKTGNAPPVIVLDADPASWNVDITGRLTVDAGASFDPEGTPLGHQWIVNGPGTAEVTLNNPEDAAEIRFPVPGVYTVNLILTDADGRSTGITREAAVYNVNGFSSFNEAILPAVWTAQNVPLRDNGHPATCYSLSDRDGYLLLHMGSDQARPLQYDGFQHPWIWRVLPESNNWILQTKIQLATRQFGTFRTGLLVEMAEGALTNRYAFSLLNGNALQVERIASDGSRSTLKTAAWSSAEATLRVHKDGSQLYWSVRQPDGSWTAFHHAAVPLDARSLRGGLFTATDSAQSLRTACDYLMLIDVDTAPSSYEGLCISEVMYDPPGGSDYEYLELVNLSTNTLNLNGLRFVDGQPFDELVLGPYLLAPGAYALVVNGIPFMRARYGDGVVPAIAGEWLGGKLSNEGERITLVDSNHVVVFSFVYGVDGRWPSRALDEGGSSLERVEPFGDLEDPTSWRASPEYLGSPGRAGEVPRTDVVINELLTHTDPPQLDSIELHNTSGSPVDIGNWYLSDSSADYRKYRIPVGTIIPTNGYVTFDESLFNPNGEWNPSPGVPGPNEFGLGSKGDELYLVEADAASNLVRFVDHEEFEAAANGVSFGRYLNSVGTEYLTPQVALSLGGSNAGPRVGPVVITEVMYHPAPGGMEFVELQNISDGPVPLFDPLHPTNTWDISGIQYAFPTNLIMSVREVILVVGGDPETFRSICNLSGAIRIFGPCAGILQNDGETIKLRRPDNPDLEETDPPMINVDVLRYEPDAPWPIQPNGAGPSLERVNPSAFANDPTNWQSSLVSGGTPGDTTLPETTPVIRSDAWRIEAVTPEFGNPTSATFQVWNRGIGTLVFTVGEDAAWLGVHPAGGTSTGPADPCTITVSYDTATLAGGVYTTSLTVADPAAANNPLVIPVTLNIVEPHVAVNPSSLSQSAPPGEDASSVYFRVWNDGNELTRLDYTVTDDAPWMEVLPTGGLSRNESESVTHELRFASSGLAPGVYTGAVTVTDRLDSAPNSPLRVPVTLNVAQVEAHVAEASDIGIGTARLNGSITNTFGRNAAVWFCYGATDGGTNVAAWEASVPVGIFPDGPVSLLVSNLWYGPAYKYRILAENSLSQAWSTNAVTFVTDSPNAPPLRGLKARTYDTNYGSSLLNPIANLLALTPTGIHTFTGDALDYENYSAFRADYPSLTVGDGERFSILWEGVFVIGPDDVGTWTLGTGSDDGSVWYIDWNRDGDYADAGELALDNNGDHAHRERTANAVFPEADCYPTVIAFYENGGSESMEAKLKKGANLAYFALEFVDGSAGSTQPLAQERPPRSIYLTNDRTDGVLHNAADAHAAFSGQEAVFLLEVLLGTTDGGAEEQAWERTIPVGVYTNTVTSDLAVTLTDLRPDTRYYCTFRARNAAETLWSASPSLSFFTRFQPQVLSLRILPQGTLRIASTGKAGEDLDLEYTVDLLQRNGRVWTPISAQSSTFLDGTNTFDLAIPPGDAQGFFRTVTRPATP